MNDFQAPETSLRGRYERAQILTLSEQLRECAEYLENPEILVYEFLQAFAAVESCCTPEAYAFASPGLEDDGEFVLETFSPGLCIHLLSASDIQEFTCVTGELDPLPPPRDRARRGGLDYLGVTEDVPPVLILGASESHEERGPYLGLLRLLNCLAELAPSVQLERLSRDLFQGELDSADLAIDLHQSIWKLEEAEDPSDGEMKALCELTRDLAELFKRQLAEQPQFADTLGRIECLEIESGGAGGIVSMERLWTV